MSTVLDAVGRTPLVRFTPRGLDAFEVYAKLESYNPTGSVKDRAAAHVLGTLLERGSLARGGLVIESTSGNFGIALAAYARAFGLRFCGVIDPRINRTNEVVMRALGADVVKVTEPDGAGGFLRTRLAAVQQILAARPGSYWLDQYANPLVAAAYAPLGDEIAAALPRLDWLFVGVGSGGTLAGVSHAVKARHPRCRIVAVDVVGSVVFGGPPGVRLLPGIGSSIVPENLQHAAYDEVVMVAEREAVRACHELLGRHALFVGASSGAVVAAAQQRLGGREGRGRPVVACIFPDRGDRYVDTVYDPAWCTSATPTPEETHALPG